MFPSEGHGAPSGAAELERAKRAYDAGDAPGAARILAPLAKQFPDQPGVQALLGASLVASSRFEQGLPVLRRAIELDASNPMPVHDLALALRHLARFDEAHAVLDGARMPLHPIILKAKADLLTFQGRHADAFEALRPGLEAASPDVAVVLAFGRIARRVGRASEGVAALDRLLTSPAMTSGLRLQALFLLADLYDATNECDRAWECLDAANRLLPSRFDADRFEGAVDRMLANWTKEAIARAPCSPDRSDLPVFIVGMPRSGTSLVEQVLASHPRCFGAGELDVITNVVARLNQVAPPAPGTGSPIRLVESPAVLTDQIVRGVGNAVLGNLRRLGPGADRVTDKLPANILHLGLISRICPGARVIRCVRDPLDTCLSCYFQNFGAALPFAYNLDHLGRFYRQCERAITHWKSVLPIPILDVVYEEVVADLEGQVRRILDFLDLEWSESCLRFHESERITRTASNDQVRKPLYKTSAGRHVRYDRHLGPLRRSLGLPEHHTDAPQ